MITLRVAKDGSGDYTEITEALYYVATLPPETPVTVEIGAGVYTELLDIRKPFLTLTGAGPSETILQYGHYALEQMEDGTNRGTFRSQSVFIDTHDVTLANLTVANTAGKGCDVGQAVALYADGDHLTFTNCRFLGSQDTIFTGPLPPSVMQTGGFRGPKEFCPRVNGRQLYEHCYIEGDIDFIFGSATAYFDHCEIHSVCSGSGQAQSYATAASTPEGQAYGYVFHKCHFTSACPPASCYLGRPWRSFAQVVLLACELDAHIRPEGWHDWGKEDAHTTVTFAEYACFGPGAQPEKRPAWVKQLSAEEAKRYAKDLVLA